MTTLASPKKSASQDYTDPEYWNGLIKMSLSKFFILCVLNQRSMHGYEVAKAVETTTQGCCSPTPGALYPVLRDFEGGGYVTATSEVVNGRERKVYSLTDRGREAFQVAVEAWTNVGACVTAGAAGRCDADGISSGGCC